MYPKVKTESDIDFLAQLANEIWHNHFGDLFDAETLPKLIQSSQSRQAIKEQLTDGYHYFFITKNDQRVGYFSYKVDPVNKEMLLSKLYLIQDQRRNGEGKKVLEFLENLCNKSGVNKLSLTVYHKNSSAVNAYQKWGFSTLGIIKRDFGNGLIFDDFKMEKTIK